MKLQTTNYKLLTPQKGFTLIEAIVATSVFAFVVSSILGVYIATIQLDRKTRSQRTVSQSARFIMDFLGKEVANGSIDYTAAACGGVVTSPTDLCIVNQNKDVEHFYLNGTNMMLKKNADTVALNPTGVKVTKLRFYVQPIHDPFVLANNTNEQPRITVVLELTSNYGTRPQDQSVMNLQSTYSELAYPVRQ